jgi:hypothetical protein
VTTRTHPGVRTEATIPDGDDPVEGLDPTRVLRDAEGGAALADLVARLRAAGFDGAPGRPGSPPPGAASRDPGVPVLAALGRGEVVTRRAADAALGPAALQSLRRCGALIVVGEEAALTARLLPMRSIYSVLPRHRVGEDIVYLGADSAILFDLVWAARGHGDHAVDLGTGNGFIAAALATRYDHVVTADLSGRCVAPPPCPREPAPAVADRRWTSPRPCAPGPPTSSRLTPPGCPRRCGPGTTVRRGGLTGFEFCRFIDQAADLLAPGAFIACLDISFADGPHRCRAPVLVAARFRGDRHETRLNDQTDLQPWAARRARSPPGTWWCRSAARADPDPARPRARSSAQVRGLWPGSGRADRRSRCRTPALADPALRSASEQQPTRGEGEAAVETPPASRR